MSLMICDKPIKNGIVGTFTGWRINGVTYDPDGNVIPDTHEADCFCCRQSLL